MKIFDAFLPMDRRQALSAGQSIPFKMEGALLFADISKFTLLMGTFIQHLGKQRGTEELSHQLDLFFDTVIEHLYDYRGSVISFSGDAITCWFGDDDGQRALAASHQIQQAVKPFASIKISDDIYTAIELKISITCGIVDRFLLGDPAITTFDVMIGKALDRLVIAESLAKKGEIIISEKIASIVKKRFL